MTTLDMGRLALKAYRRVLPGWGLRRWLGIILAVSLISLLPRALAEADWLELPSILGRAALWGSIAGWLLGRLGRGKHEIIRNITFVLLIAVGVLYTAVHHSRVLPPMQAGLREVGAQISWVAGEAWNTARDRITDYEHIAIPQPTMPEWDAGSARWALYLLNLQQDWPPVIEPDHWDSGQLLMSTLLAGIVFLLAGMAVWLLARGESAWAALIPIGGMLALNVYLTDGGWLYPIIAIALALALDGELVLRALERRWPAGSVYSWLSQEWWIWVSAFAMLALTVMGIVLGLTDPKFHEWVNSLLKPQEVAEGQSGRSNSRRQPQAPPPGIWPRDHLLGSGFELSQQPAMSVRTPGSPPADFYWRATSYDQYTGHGWLRTFGRNIPGLERELWPESTDPPAGYALMRQEFLLEFDSRQIYAAGRPVRLNFPAEALWSDDRATDLIAVHTFTETSAYQVMSWVPAFDEADLRAATGEYPDWATARYLQLPEETSDRVLVLARTVTSGKDNQYERALAIQEYLREYEYTLNLPAPPEDVDVVEHFLFEEQRGYCDYYASAMVVMARAAGIPARLVVGYRMGVWDAEAQVYRVTLADAHSWPELYFPEIGWIPFEPTAAYPTLARGLPDDWGAFAEAPIPQEPEWVEPPPENPINWRVLLPLLVIVGVVIGTGLFIALRDAIHEWRRRKLPPDQLIASLYYDAVKSGRKLGVRGNESQTPYEFSEGLIDEMAFRGHYLPTWSGDWEARAEPIREAITSLTRTYAEGLYSPRHTDRAAADRMLALWPAIKWGLLRFRIAAGARRLVLGEIPREWISAPAVEAQLEASGD